MGVLLILANQAILPNETTPQPATIEVDLDTGTISGVKKGEHRVLHASQFLEIPEHHVILPGLIE
jgi:hypothetical protein